MNTKIEFQFKILCVCLLIGLLAACVQPNSESAGAGVPTKSVPEMDTVREVEALANDSESDTEGGMTADSLSFGDASVWSDGAQQIPSFMQLVDAQTVCVDKQRGFLTLRLKFGNSYKKAIESVVFSYSFRDSVGNVRFSERARISKAVGGKFKGVCTFLIPENYNAVAAFMFADVPVQAPESMQIALGKKRANRKVERDFLLRGLRVSPLKVIFADGSSVVPKAN